MTRLTDAYRAIVLEQQHHLETLVRSSGLAPVRRLYQDMLDEITRKLQATAEGSFTQAQLRSAMAQIKLGMNGVLRQMSDKVGDAAYDVGLASARTMLTDVAKLEHTFTGVAVSVPVLEAARLRGLVEGQTSSLLRYHDASMARYGTHLVGRMELALSAGLASGDSHTQAIDRIQEVGAMEWHRAERIVRTELAYASSATARAAADEQSEELDGDLWTRWTEHVSDGGSPLDDRVGEDSEAMHGQVAPPGKEFHQPGITPQGEQVQRSLVGKSWPHPPNRPNDRAVLTPWRAHWGVPGWIYRAGARVPATRKLVAEINGLAPRRPPPQTEQPEETPVAKSRAAELEQSIEAPILREARGEEAMVGPDLQPAWVEAPAIAPPPTPRAARAARSEANRIQRDAERLAARQARDAAKAAIKALDQPIPTEAEAPPPLSKREQLRAGIAARREAREEARALREAMAPPKNPKRVAAAKVAAEASAERVREIWSAVKSNLPSDLHVVWDKEGHKFLKQEAGRIHGIKDRINAASKISEAFSETYGSGDLGGKFGNEGDRFFKRNEIEVEHFEAKADEQERKYYEEIRRQELEAGRIDEHGEPTKHGHAHAVDEWGEPVHQTSKPKDDDPPF